MFGKHVTGFTLIKRFVKKFKYDSNYSAMQQTLRRLDKSYKRFFKNISKKPRYQKRFRTIEYAKHGDGCKVNLVSNILYLQNVGKISIVAHRDIKFPIKTLSVTKKYEYYYVNIICKTPIYSNDINKLSDKSVGVDFGIKNVITTSDNEQISAPKPLKSRLKQLSKSTRLKKYKVSNKIYKKITNIRKDFNHKLSKILVDNYDIICLEDIHVEDWLTNIENINKAIYDINIGQLINFITYKAERAGKRIVLVSPYNTTKICSNCGKIVNKTINQRIHTCSCGFSCDRDINAANNILRLGLQSRSA
jgi:putative transposase